VREERENAPWRRIITCAKWIYAHVAHIMFHMVTSVQSVDVNASVMMWHLHHCPKCCHGSKCKYMDLKAISQILRHSAQIPMWGAHV